MRPQQKTDLLKRWALEEGFDLVGVAALGPSAHQKALKRWLERGDQASMSYLERRFDDRVDPRRLLPDAVSALCVALQYYPLAGADEPTGDLWPRVARYAHGEDYHLVMERRLRRLGERIETAFPGARSRAYVDTGPILERELAARAGLGAIGKNTVLMHPAKGSWLLLGELLLTLDLVADSSFSDLCGTCTACLDACPTGALPEPYRLDSRLCISYWTIEHRGAIPRSIDQQLGAWVFGCDICQEVCPINETAGRGGEERLRLPPVRAALDLDGVLSLSRDEYVERFRHSPMKRAKLAGLQRNSAAAMGNRRDRGYVDSLVRALDNESAAVRLESVRSLAKIGGEQTRDALEAARSGEASPAVVEAILEALRALSGSSSS